MKNFYLRIRVKAPNSIRLFLFTHQLFPPLAVLNLKIYSMKQNVVMIRKMGNFDVSQRTKDGMFNATALLKQWNHSGVGKKKEMGDFLSNKSTKEFIEALEYDENLNTGIPIFKTHTVNKGKYGGTWMSPLLFIDFAMWLNPRFKVQVLRFVYDELIKQRNYAGDNYRLLSASGVKLIGYDFREVAKALNFIIFNKHEKGLREKATEQQLQELKELEEKLSFLIDNNYIASYEQLISDMRKMYNKKYRKF